ncbi:MAG: hypothetical protein U9M94_02805, partial [Patescibacteria group bacterium]|nr:hypothetical protein [Patescibacteria group bacterium]
MKKRIIKTKRYIYLIIFLAILFFCQMLLIPFNLVLAETKKEPINNEFVEYAISAQTENVVKQIEVYLQANPDKTIKDLSQDEIFKDIVFQPVGERGYGAIADPATAYLKLHPDKAMLNKDLSFIGEKAPEWWALFNRAMKEEFCDYYIWPENDGSMSNKYLCAKFITINNKQYGFAVTAYANEFRDVIKNNDAATTYFDEYENMETKTKSEKGAEKICLTKIVYGFLGVLAVIFLMLSIFNQLGIIKIERNTFFYLLPIALLMIIGLFLFSTWRITRNMKEKISISAAESLKALVVSRTEHINTLIDGYKNTTEILAVGNPFRDVFDEKIEYKKRIQQTNRRIKAVLGADLQISRIRILNKDGGIVASSFENDTIT